MPPNVLTYYTDVLNLSHEILEEGEEGSFSLCQPQFPPILKQYGLYCSGALFIAIKGGEYFIEIMFPVKEILIESIYIRHLVSFTTAIFIEVGFSSSPFRYFWIFCVF